MKTFYMLCGIPGSGKSTWVSEFNPNPGKSSTKIMVLSTDDIIQDIAERHGLTYNDVFGDISYSFAERMMYKLADIAFKTCDIVIWDQTNLNAKTRARKLKLVPKDWNKVAVYFDVPDDIQTRLASRPGKNIPDKVIASMIRTYKIPTIDEGFDEVFSYKYAQATKVKG